MGVARPTMQDVVIVDVSVPSRAELPNGGLPKRAPAPRATRRRLRRWSGAAGAALLLVAVATVADDRHESARLTVLAGVPGVLAPLDGPVTSRWRDDGAQFSGLTGVSGRLLGVEDLPDGSVQVVALDPRSGRAAWRTPVRPPQAIATWARCAWPQAPTPASPGPRSGAAGETSVGTCVVVDDAATHENAAGFWTYPTRARLLRLDAATGTVLSAAQTEPSTSVCALGPDLIVSEVDADGRLRVTRTDASGRVARWTFTSPAPLPDDASGRPQAQVRVVGEVVVVAAGPGWVLSGAGVVLESWPVGAQAGRAGAGAGANARTPIAANPDDGSLGGLSFTQPAPGVDLVALDAAGRTRWTASGVGHAGTAIAGLMVIDGRVIVAEAGALRSIDGSTGTTVWSTPITNPARTALFTDGRVIVRSESTKDRGVVLAAYGLDDGRLRWESDIADGALLLEVDGRLYARSDQGLISLG